MDMVLQLWGGGAYLANKILFALAERKDQGHKRLLKIWAWAIYILGVPAWVIILVAKRDWIAAAIEAGGVPAMLLGLYTVHQGLDAPPRRLDLAASIFTYGFIILGTGTSLVENAGISSLSQVLEMGVMVGFLLGSYFLAKNLRVGWLFFMLMNLSMAFLMLIQDKPLLTAQQLFSLGFVVWGFTLSLRSPK